MAKTLYVLGVVMLISAGILSTLSWAGWPQEIPYVSDFSRSKDSGMAESPKNTVGQATVLPLVAQATAFAQYLKPCESPTPRTPPRLAAGVQQPVFRPAIVTPKFTLLSTSYYRSSPEKSLALVVEPGKGGYWIGKGDRVGHLGVESVTDGAIVCRDGDRLLAITVSVKDTVPLARLKSSASVAFQDAGAAAGPWNAARLNTRGTRMPIVQATIDEGLE